MENITVTSEQATNIFARCHITDRWRWVVADELGLVEGTFTMPIISFWPTPHITFPNGQTFVMVAVESANNGLDDNLVD